MRNTGIVEAFLELNKIKPSRKQIYMGSLDGYSGFKRLELQKELSMQISGKRNYGIIPQINVVWYLETKKLVFYYYMKNIVNVIKGFSALESQSKIFITPFEPNPSVFNEDIVDFCLFVTTCEGGTVLAIEKDTLNIVETEFSCRFRNEIPSFVVSQGQHVYIGTEQGTVFAATCELSWGFSSRKMVVTRNMSYFQGAFSYFKSISHLFSRVEKNGVKALSVFQNYLISLSNSFIQIYTVDGQYLKLMSTISYTGEYSDVQIVEIETNNVFFYAITPAGSRDFYRNDQMVFSRHCDTSTKSYERSIMLNSHGQSRNLVVEFVHDKNSLVEVHARNDMTYLSLVSFNTDAEFSHSRSKFCENLDTLVFPGGIFSMVLYKQHIFILAESGLMIYKIKNDEELLVTSRNEDIYPILRNFGEVYLRLIYYSILTSSSIPVNESSTRACLACIENYSANGMVDRFCLFMYMAEILQPIWKLDISKEIRDNQNNMKIFETVWRKMKILSTSVLAGEPKSFIDDFLQTVQYLDILSKYSVKYSETLEALLTQDIEFFKEQTFESLMKIFKASSSIDQLNRILCLNCPKFFSDEQMNLSRGIDRLSSCKNPKEMHECLPYLKFVSFSRQIFDYFVSMKFYYGGAFLLVSNTGSEKKCRRNKITKNFPLLGEVSTASVSDMKYEELVDLFRMTVKCQGSMEVCLPITDEKIIFPFFEALVLLSNFSPCICCASNLPGLHMDREVQILKIENPLFLPFLKSRKSSDERIFNLEWKYYAYRGKKEKAVETLLGLTERSDLSLVQKLGALKKAKSLNPSDDNISLRLALYDIQERMVKRKGALRLTVFLSADTLLNDYCYDEPDLALEILDLLCYKKDKKVLRDFYLKFFEKASIEEFYDFVKKLKNKDLSLIIDLLVLKIDKKEICRSLLAAGFEYNEIITHMKLLLMDNNSPKVKRMLLQELRLFSKNDEYDTLRNMCSNSFGI